MTTKICRVCNTEQPTENFQHHFGMRDGRKNECRECCRKYNRAREIKNGHAPFNKTKSCSWFLGVHVAERLLESVFKDVARMPRSNPGFDFICGKGYKIDVKSSCLLNTRGSKYRHWLFTTKRNIVPDYFACIGFDNRENTIPIHFWLIPRDEVGNRVGLIISESDYCISKWGVYEKPITDFALACETMRVVG